MILLNKDLCLDTYCALLMTNSFALVADLQTCLYCSAFCKRVMRLKFHKHYRQYKMCACLDKGKFITT